MVESSDSFHPALPVAATMNAAVHSQLEWDQGGLFQVRSGFVFVTHYGAFIISKPATNILRSFPPSISSGWCVRWRRASTVSSGIVLSLPTVSWRPPSTKKCIPETWKRRMELCKCLPHPSQTPPHVDTPSLKSPPASFSAALPVSSTKLLKKKKSVWICFLIYDI